MKKGGGKKGRKRGEKGLKKGEKEKKGRYGGQKKGNGKQIKMILPSRFWEAFSYRA